MNILITGGAGFIGSAVIRDLINNTNHSVINVDCLTYAGNLESLWPESTNNRYKFEQINICDHAELKRVVFTYQPDAIMHLAAESHVDRSIDGPLSFIKTNIFGTYILLEVAREYWNGLHPQRRDAFRFHHVSTDEVYGDLGDSMELFTEVSPYKPSSPYSASKASSDHLVRAWHCTYGLPIIISNCSNNYGPCQFPEKLIPHMILNALRGEALPVYGKGEQIRDWLYVEDHAVALRTVLVNGVVGDTYNIGGNNQQRNIDVVELICELLEKLAPEKKPKNIELYRDLITFVTDRPGHDMRYAIDASKIQRELGWRPIETFDSGLCKTVQWYLDNEEWWQRVLNGNYRLVRLGVRRSGEKTIGETI